MKNRAFVAIPAALAALTVSLLAPVAAQADGSLQKCGAKAFKEYGTSCDGWMLSITNKSAFDLRYSDNSKRVHTEPGDIPAAAPGVTPTPNTLTRGYLYVHWQPDDIRVVFDSADLADGWQRVIRLDTYSNYPAHGNRTATVCGVSQDGGKNVVNTVGCTLVKHPRPANAGSGVAVLSFTDLSDGEWKKK